ncbi:hypothetical protein niasHT_033304 [Heterodera trifolii]|uniref:Nuclear receptor domain-containing protein n=1 Tax=Heterodera trifolii TaxID=157864 RepID=A0ABD2I9H5_9BILA
MKSCRACRLDKCLLEGMDPSMVEAEQSPAQRQFIQSLSKRREFLQQQLQKKNEKETKTKNEKDTQIKNEKDNNENGTSNEINEENQTFYQTPDPIQANLSNEFCRSETVPVIGLLHTMPQFVMLEPTDQANFTSVPLTINGLSDAGRLALQHLSEHYTNALMNHLRTNHGNMAATLRYAELARHAESLLFSARRQQTEFYQRRN